MYAYDQLYLVILGLLLVYSDDFVDSLVHNSFAVRNTKINTIYAKQTNNINNTTRSKNPQIEKKLQKTAN